MVAPLGRRSGRESSQVRKICFYLWTWKGVIVEMLGNTRRSGVVTSTSPWRNKRISGAVTSTPPCKSHQNWQSGQDENHIFRVKRKIGNIRKGVGYRSGFQDQSKVQKSTKSQGMPSKISARRTFLELLGFLRKLINCLMRRRGQTWAYWQLI